MLESSEFQQDWVSPPGQTLLELLEVQGLSDIDLADRLGIRLEDADSLINGTLEIDEKIAESLSHHFGASQDFWIAREKQYRAHINRGVSANKKDISEQEWLRCLPVSDMMKFGWIAHSKIVKEKVLSCLAFFGVSSIREWQEVHRTSIAVSAFRTTYTFDSNCAAVSAWLRKGEIEAAKIQCSHWNPDRLTEIIPQLRRLTWTRDPKVFLPKLKKLLSNCGVALVIARSPNGCRASGATRFISKSNALILLSFRHLSDDHFWFSLFHEIGHLMLHGENALFLEDESDVTEDEEREADTFAGDALIPLAFKEELYTMNISDNAIKDFSRKVGISPGIIIGQLQHEGIIPHKKMNYFKRRYKWDDIT